MWSCGVSYFYGIDSSSTSQHYYYFIFINGKSRGDDELNFKSSLKMNQVQNKGDSFIKLRVETDSNLYRVVNTRM